MDGDKSVTDQASKENLWGSGFNMIQPQRISHVMGELCSLNFVALAPKRAELAECPSFATCQLPMLQDPDGVAKILQQCYGKGGDLTIVVEPGEDGDGSAREFQVWSCLLSEWSDVFKAMLNPEHGFQEQQLPRIVSWHLDHAE